MGIAQGATCGKRDIASAPSMPALYRRPRTSICNAKRSGVMMSNSEKMRSSIRLVPVAALALGLCLCVTKTALAGEVTYKSIDPNGEISYSRRPDPSALRSETIEIDTLTPEQRRAIARFQQEEVKAGHDANVYAAGLDEKWTRVDNEIAQAHAQLQKAEGALQAGREPLPGERRGNRGGGSRLTQAYFDRLHTLELDIQRAKLRLDNAYEARNALR
jgi:hypothetical protein